MTTTATTAGRTSSQARRARIRRGKLILIVALVATRLGMYLQVAIPEGDLWPFP